MQSSKGYKIALFVNWDLIKISNNWWNSDYGLEIMYAVSHVDGKEGFMTCLKKPQWVTDSAVLPTLCKDPWFHVYPSLLSYASWMPAG